MVQYSFTSTETRRLVRTDSPVAATSTLTQLLNYGVRVACNTVLVNMIVCVGYRYEDMVIHTLLSRPLLTDPQGFS